MNLLASETSPYLLQHLTNPVNWHPWNKNAFDEARERNVPILLSIGYSSCHWCHVMAHESFEDSDIASLMNDNFVNIKVDREERPDIDSIYMNAVTAITGRGGWPLTVFCHHDGRPFHGGTYWPNIPKNGMPSFPQILTAITDAWKTKRDDLDGLGNRLLVEMERHTNTSPSVDIAPRETISGAVESLISQHDPNYGGFGVAPKFPQAMSLELLIRDTAKNDNKQAKNVITTTLDAMASGGIYDQLGGGFSRYSVDQEWTVPHFEKMLYDNALLAKTYLHAWQIFGYERWLQVASETIDYVRRDLRHSNGGFYSSEDADSEGIEGKFYVWGKEEVETVCTSNSKKAVSWYGVTEIGNFEGANILTCPKKDYLPRPKEIEELRILLFESRNTRIRPNLDDKILTEWNGLMLSTLAEAALVTGREDWLEDAKTNANFLLKNLCRDDGRWYRSWQEKGGARHLGYAADHIAIADGLLKLGEATGESYWTNMAVKTAEVLLELFTDQENGGFFSTGSDAEKLPVRPKDVFDNAHPSANSMAALTLKRLFLLTGETKFSDAADSVLRLLNTQVLNHPTAFAHLLQGLDLFYSPKNQIVVTGNRPDLVAAVTALYLPNTVLAWGEPRSGLLWDGKHGDQAWICENNTCQAPISSLDKLVEHLQENSL